MSKAYCLFALAKQSKALGANKLARVALERLQTFKVPIAWQEQVDLFALTIRARPPADDDELQPSCFRCQTINPLLNPQGDKCTACGHPFIRSFVNFEHLPLVRFMPTRDIRGDEAISLIRRAPPLRRPRSARSRRTRGPTTAQMCRPYRWPEMSIRPRMPPSILTIHSQRRCSTLSRLDASHRLWQRTRCYCRWSRRMYLSCSGARMGR